MGKAKYVGSSYPDAQPNGIVAGGITKTRGEVRERYWSINHYVEKFAFGDRTIPIHARTLGPHLESPNVMGMYYGTVQSAVVHTN
jgi:hypothetical protein